MPADPEEESVQLLGPGEPLGPIEIDGPFLTERTPFVMPDGTEHTIVVVRGLDDITEAQRTVARGLAVRDAGDPGDRRARDLVDRRANTSRPVAEAHERQRRFVSDAAHELRSPVASIRAHAEVASAHPETTDVHDLAGVVGREGVRLQDLVDDLLLLARLDEGASPMSHVEVDLDDVVLAEAARLRSASRACRWTPRRSAPAGCVGDARALERSVRNLGDNAARHAAGRVELLARGARRARDAPRGRRRSGDPCRRA